MHEGAGLRVSHDDADHIIKTTRQLATLTPRDALSFQPDGKIREAELSFFRNAARLLRSHEAASFVLGELSDAETHLLVAAARARVRSEGLDAELDSRPLTVRFLAGGRSGARLAIVVCGDTPTFVAKITAKDLALDEMMRFRTFVQPWNEELRPDCHFHGGAAVILFGLVRADVGVSHPAQSLEQRLEDLWNRQWMQQNTEPIAEETIFLARALARAARTLAGLNTKKPRTDVTLQSSANPSASHFDALDASGFVWGLSERAAKARVVAAERCRSMAESAVVHGDIHLRNILIRGDSEIQLIDYAAAGPGHPALDLVRLELALYLGAVRQFENEATSVAFQRSLSIEWVALEDLRRDFPVFFQCHINVACATGMTEARNAALDVLRSHGGDRRDYLAMKFLVAWQNLGTIGTHTGLARAVIVALTDELAA